MLRPASSSVDSRQLRQWQSRMKPILFYDTETTGLPDFQAPSEAPHQPHIVQLAAVLVEPDTRKALSSLNVVIRPEGWTIPAGVAAIHGITTEIAQDVGIPEGVALSAFLEMWNGRQRVAHNEPFDARVIRIAMLRFCGGYDADVWKQGPSQCTARMAAPICKIPPTERMVAAGRGHFKTANLTEAFRYFTGNDLEGAHNAMSDVNACIAIYFSIKDSA